MTNLDYLQDQKSCLISIKVFSDDFAALVKDQYAYKLQSGDYSVGLIDSLVLNQFVWEHLKIRLNGKHIGMKDWRIDSVKNNYEASWLFYSIEFREQLQEVSVRNTIFFNVFNDQKNLMVIANGDEEKAIQFTQRKSAYTVRFWAHGSVFVEEDVMYYESA